ncbi:hypothetical protein V7S43_014907 [Phytophthora oleae]|uniref:Uncharacterized protein n=1 Tax=Phytophthora oleae TaxID=2107226 RepID=A0ABD3F0D1_9STRA
MLHQLALAAIIFNAAAISQTAGHGNIIVPKPQGNAANPYYIGGPAGTIDMPKIIGSASYGDYYQAVDDWFTKNNVASLKEYITTYGTGISECGNTEKKGTAQSVPSDGYAQHDTLGNSHPGPCEIWCDDTRVFHDTNCVTTFSGQSPAKIPIDVSTCKSSSEFVFYWLALHAQPWQVYINCVALDGTTASYTSGSASTTSTDTSTTTTSTAASTEASAADEAPATTDVASTEAPTAAPSSMESSVTGSAASHATSETGEADEADDTVTTATATSTDKCSIRRHRK